MGLLNQKKNNIRCGYKNCRENTMKVDIKRDQIKYVGNNPKIKSGNFMDTKVNKSSNKILKLNENWLSQIIFIFAVSNIIKKYKSKLF